MKTRVKKKRIKQDYEYLCVDPVTGSNSYHALLTQGAIALEKHNKGLFVLISLDIKQFKLINEAYGYSYGNKVLKSIINELIQFFDGRGTIFRKCDNQLVVLFSKEKNENLLELIQRLSKITEVIKVEEDREHTLTIVMGVYEIPKEEKSMIACLDKADTARGFVEQRAKKRYVFYNKSLTDELMQKRVLEQELKEAFEKSQFEVYLQPKIVLATEKIRGAEALVRWIHPKKGMIVPDQFIPVLEENDEIKRLDFYVLDRVCQLICKWKKENRVFHPIAINLSKVYLKDRVFINEILEVLGKYHIAPKYIQLEITESASLNEGEDFIGLINKLKKEGFLIAMDDFGTGYSSLSLLKDLPIDVLKLDKEFIVKIDEIEKSRIIITCMVQMAHQLNMVVISEGVETKEQATFLKEIGCDGAQGYLYAKPMCIEEYEQLDIEGE